MLITFLPIVFLFITLVGVLGLILIFWQKRAARAVRLKKNNLIVKTLNEPIEEDVSTDVSEILSIRREPKLQMKFDDVATLPEKREVKTETTPTKEDFIITYLVAPPGKKYGGYDMLQSLLDTGLRFGKMNIFHYHATAEEDSPILFSVASAAEPGVFDLLNIGGFTCPGLTLFMRSAQTQTAKRAFEKMIEVGRRLEETLGGQLYDHERNPLTQEAIKKYREDL